jgi:hypothetical protein
MSALVLTLVDLHVRRGAERLPAWRAALAVSIAAVVLATTTSTPGLMVSDGTTARCEMAIEFLTPSDWRCVGEDAERCTVCRNVSDHTSEIVVGCVGAEAREHQRVPKGAELSICRGDMQQALSPL